MQEPQFDSWVGKIHWRRDRLPTPLFLGFPCGSAGKKSACNVGNLGSIPGLGRSPGKGKGYPLQSSGLEDHMSYIVHGVAKSQTRLSNFHFPMSVHGASQLVLVVKNLPANAGDVRDMGLTPGLGRFPGEGNGYQLQYSGLENSLDSIVHGVSKSQTQLSNFHFQIQKVFNHNFIKHIF